MSSDRNSPLRVQAVEFQYPGGRSRFGPFTFAAHPGEVWAVLGSNGAGKSTLLRLIAGDLNPASGTIHNSGSVELIPQGVSIPGRLTVSQTFEYLALLRGVPRAERAERVADAIRAVGLTDQADAKIGKLSGGQQRRAVIGQALTSRPHTLLMDEPSAGLDLDQRETLRTTVAGIGRDRLVMVSSHIVEDLVGVANHVLHIVEGTVVFAGSSVDYLRVVSPDPTDDASNEPDTVERWMAAYRVWNAPHLGDTP